MIKFEIITIFPEVFENYFNTSIIKRAKEKGLIEIKVHNLRKWAKDKHKTVDDRVYGGGPGMILKADVIYRAVKSLERSKNIKKESKTILLTPAGKQFNQKIAQRYAKLKRIILICGRYEGVDARVEKFVDEKISIGPYVLTGGELPAMVIVDAVTRLIPGVIKKESLEEESFSFKKDKLGIGHWDLGFYYEYPQYTRPAVLKIRDKSGQIKVLKVPKVLLSGNHQKIKEWREKRIKVRKI
jgi:tRNA (guanine37-N1)-methyltransferase